MKIIIEIEGGCVSGVYRKGGGLTAAEIVVVDLDPAKIDGKVRAQNWTPMPLSEASGITRRLLK